MNRLASALALFGAALIATSALSTADAAAPGPTKVGVIDLEKTLYETPAGKRASEAFDKTRKSKQAELAGERAKLIQELLKKASPIIQDIAKGEGVTLVVDQSAVLWADSSLDLTAKLNARMK